MKIQQLSNKTGLSAHTIRFYEKEGLLDARHIKREANNYRNYTDQALARLELIKKFQGIGCSIAELKEIMHHRDNDARSNEEIIVWIRNKMIDVENKKKEYDQMLHTLKWMLEYRVALEKNPKKANLLLASHALNSNN